MIHNVLDMSNLYHLSLPLKFSFILAKKGNCLHTAFFVFNYFYGLRTDDILTMNYIFPVLLLSSCKIFVTECGQCGQV